MQPRPFPLTASEPAFDPRDAALDDTIASSFPASDPPSSIPDPSFVRSASLDSPAAADWTTGRVARAIDAQAARLPSDPFLWAAVGSMGASAALQLAGKRHASLFVGQWAPALLLLGIYNALVAPLGSDRFDRS